MAPENPGENLEKMLPLEKYLKTLEISLKKMEEMPKRSALEKMEEGVVAVCGYILALTNSTPEHAMEFNDVDYGTGKPWLIGRAAAFAKRVLDTLV